MVDFINLGIPGKSGFYTENMFYLMLNKTYLVDGFIKCPPCHGTFVVGGLGYVPNNVLKILEVVLLGH